MRTVTPQNSEHKTLPRVKGWWGEGWWGEGWWGEGCWNGIQGWWDEIQVVVRWDPGSGGVADSRGGVGGPGVVGVEVAHKQRFSALNWVYSEVCTRKVS